MKKVSETKNRVTHHLIGIIIEEEIRNYQGKTNDNIQRVTENWLTNKKKRATL